MAEGTIIQGAKILMCPKPISGDGVSHMFDDQIDDVLGAATVEPNLLRGSGLPESTKGGDTEEGPQAEDVFFLLLQGGIQEKEPQLEKNLTLWDQRKRQRTKKTNDKRPWKKEKRPKEGGQRR